MAVLLELLEQIAQTAAQESACATAAQQPAEQAPESRPRSTLGPCPGARRAGAVEHLGQLALALIRPVSEQPHQGQRDRRHAAAGPLLRSAENVVQQTHDLAPTRLFRGRNGSRAPWVPGDEGFEGAVPAAAKVEGLCIAVIALTWRYGMAISTRSAATSSSWRARASSAPYASCSTSSTATSRRACSKSSSRSSGRWP